MIPARWLARAGVPLALPVAWAWAGWCRRRALRHGRALDDEARALARAVGVADPDRVRVWLLPGMPVPGRRLWERLFGPRVPWAGTTAMTLGPAVLCFGAPPDPLLLAHELRHVQQFESAGSLRAFLAAYLRQVARHGYRDAPWEVDARAAAYSAVAGGPHSRR